MIASVFLASVLVLVLGGFLLMQQATLGVMEGKKESVRNESRQALFAAQQQLNAADPTGGANVDKLLTDLAFGYANRTGGTDQFEVIILAGRSDHHRRPGRCGERARRPAPAGIGQHRPADDADRRGLPRRCGRRSPAWSAARS